MARIGDTVRPELGKVDTRAIAQGGAAMGRGLAGLGAGIGDYFKQQKEDVKEMEGSAALLDSFAAANEGTKQGDAALITAAQIRDQESPKSTRLGLASKVTPMLNMFSQGMERAIDAERFNAEMGLKRQHADINRQNAEINKGRAGREESEFLTKESDQRAFTKASQFLANEFDPNRPPESRETMLEVFAPENPKDRETYMGMVAEGMRRQQATDAVSATKRATTMEPAERARRVKVGQDVAAWEGGGRRTAETNLIELDSIIEDLESGEINTGLMARMGGKLLNPSLSDARSRINRIVFQTLRATLGSQFTEKEGERLMETAFDTGMNEERNVARLKLARDELKARVKDAEKQVINVQTGFSGGGGGGGAGTPSGEGLSRQDIIRGLRETQKKSDPGMTGDAGPLGARDDVPPPKNYSVFSGTRDQVKSFRSQPGGRFVSLDFNDADNKSARGIEIKVPSDATKAEIEAAEQWAKKTQQFLASKGVKVPIRHGNGVKRGGRGKRGVFHTEPFFASNAAARNAIASNGQEYASILGSTLGTISGVTFIAPHTQSDPGTTSGDIGEREFAMKYIIPHL